MKQRRLLRLFLIMIFSLMIGFGIVRLIPYTTDLIASRQTSRELQQIYNQGDSDHDPSIRVLAETAFPSLTPVSVTETPQPEDTASTDSTEEGILQSVQYPDNPGL